MALYKSVYYYWLLLLLLSSLLCKTEILGTHARTRGRLGRWARRWSRRRVSSRRHSATCRHRRAPGSARQCTPTRPRWPRDPTQMIAITADARPALRRRLSGCTITIYLHSLITAIVHGHQTRKKLPLMKDRGQTDRVTILVNCNSNIYITLFHQKLVDNKNERKNT